MAVLRYGTSQSGQIISWKYENSTLFSYENNICQIMEFSVSYDTRMEADETEKIEKCQDLARELKKLWKMNVKLIPIVISALEAPPRKWEKCLDRIAVETNIVDLHHLHCEDSPKSSE